MRGLDPPVVTAITPNTGVTTGSTAITNLAGTGFQTGCTVRIGGTLATSVVRVSATRITCVTPIGTVGAKNVLVTNPDGLTSGTSGNGLFTYTAAGTNPSTLPLRLFTTPNYGGTPWLGSASAGISGNASFGFKAGVAPSVGAAVNGMAPADFNGTTQYLTTSGTSQVTPFLATGPSSRWVGTIWFVFKTRTAAAPSGFGLSDVALFNGSSGSISMGVINSGGFGAGFGFVAPSMVACSLNNWHFGCVRLNGTDMFINVDGAAKSTFLNKFSAATDLAFNLGTTFNATTKYDGSVLYTGGQGTMMSDGDVALLGAYLQSLAPASFAWGF